MQTLAQKELKRMERGNSGYQEGCYAIRKPNPHTTRYLFADGTYTEINARANMAKAFDSNGRRLAHLNLKMPK